MKTLILPATGLELLVPDNFYYHDDGIVRSIALHREKLYKRYGKYFEPLELPVIINKKSGKKQEIKPKGMSLTFYPWEAYDSVVEAVETGEDVNCHVFFSYTRDKINVIKSKGHEETHTLLNFGKEFLIQEGLESLNVHSLGFRSLSNEAKCEIGGLYACLHNYGIREMEFSFDRRTHDEVINFLRRNTNWRIERK